ncbi:MAG: ketol-acid reductoisomerase [Candidatus Eisenbacteria bacterium]|nr:ketol-acid reductoisomerase [Candidatus Eisenbacteria bacterium]
MKIITEKDIDGDPLGGRTICVFGYGSQGEAQALNLRDSGAEVVVALPAGSRSRERAEREGFEVVDPGEGARRADVCALLVPDEIMSDFVRETVSPNIREGTALVFAHGFSLRFAEVDPPAYADVIVVAPMGPGLRLRERFMEGKGLPASFSVEQDATGTARATALGYAKAIGCARVGLFETTAAEETEVDLFAEQAVLCGGVTRLIEAGFDTLVEAGYSPELAYMECLYELDLTVSLIVRFGLSGLRKRISGTALYGDLTRGDRIIGSETREAMREILREIQDGTFARQMVSDERSGGKELHGALSREREKLIEETGRRLAAIAHPEAVPDSS